MDISNSNIDLTGDWLGWRQRGRWLVSDNGQRITIGRLRGLLWREQMEIYRQGFASRRKAEQAKRRQALAWRLRNRLTRSKHPPA